MKSAHRPSLLAVTAAHITVDMHTGSLVVLLPLLLSAFDLSYASAAAIITANNLVIAVAQPLFGIFGDKRSLGLARLGGVCARRRSDGLGTLRPELRARAACRDAFRRRLGGVSPGGALENPRRQWSPRCNRCVGLFCRWQRRLRARPDAGDVRDAAFRQTGRTHPARSDAAGASPSWRVSGG